MADPVFRGGASTPQRVCQHIILQTCCLKVHANERIWIRKGTIQNFKKISETHTEESKIKTINSYLLHSSKFRRAVSPRRQPEANIPGKSCLWSQRSEEKIWEYIMVRFRKCGSLVSINTKRVWQLTNCVLPTTHASQAGHYWFWYFCQGNGKTWT